MRDATDQIIQYTESGITITGLLRIGDIDNDGSMDLTVVQGDANLIFSGIQRYDGLVSIQWDVLETKNDYGMTYFIPQDDSGKFVGGSVGWGASAPYEFHMGPFNNTGTRLEWSQQQSWCSNDDTCQFGGTMSIDNFVFDVAYIPPSIPEPSQFWLLVLGFPWLLAAQRRHRNRK